MSWKNKTTIFAHEYSIVRGVSSIIVLPSKRDAKICEMPSTNPLSSFLRKQNDWNPLPQSFETLSPLTFIPQQNRHYGKEIKI